MNIGNCSLCKCKISADYVFCPNCGNKLRLICTSCEFSNEHDAHFCQKCGDPLNQDRTAQEKSVNEGQITVEAEILELEEPPESGITLEFMYSTAQSFEFAVECAKKLSNYVQFREGKKAIYRITADPSEIETTLELINHLKGWRKKSVYINGEKVAWDSVFQFVWCHERKVSSFKPAMYCYGYENEWSLNIWGCLNADMAFQENAEWLCWGKWINKKGDWKFDKERIGHYLQKSLYSYRYCPALNLEYIEDVLKSFPDVVNPIRDKNWKFVEAWGDDNEKGLVVSIDRFGYKEEAVMKGVAPRGLGALKELAKRMKNRFPIEIKDD